MGGKDKSKLKAFNKGRAKVRIDKEDPGRMWEIESLEWTWGRMRRKGNPPALGMGVHPLWITVWSCLRKWKLELPYDPEVPLREYIWRLEILIQKNMSTPVFIAALSTIAKVWKQAKCPSVDEWIKKLWYIWKNPNWSKTPKLFLWSQHHLNPKTR